MMTENQRVAEETMSKTDNNSAADMTETQGVLVLPFSESWGGGLPSMPRSSLSERSFTQTLEEMGTRIDDLEKNVVDLMLQAGMKEQEIAKQ
ncbi:hypothetical protein D4764_21G0003510 [Takifugu flavidus]|uniref:Heat shock factor-binding protein 1 n=1 Tax=Takifugu flavidus TaxID=433684 RepID=A0A5C6NFS7_9TELE|nr:hypothetical protein D4764_21G0003510 [Takifugu flavidus]